MGTQADSVSTGNSESNGIIPRVVQQIFSRLTLDDGSDQLTVSFLEIYREQIFDLLHPQRDVKNINIREASSGELVVSGISRPRVNAVEEVLELLDTGVKNRTTGSTQMHDHSSRSHSVFTIYLQRRLEDNSIQKSKISLVDLAGSERLKRTKLDTNGLRFQESVKINAGLLALGNVIRQLSEQSRHPPTVADPLAQTHISYRQSKLTRLLQDALGGNCYTVMIACISPFWGDFEETGHTVAYASRVRWIRNSPKKNIVLEPIVPVDEEGVVESEFVDDDGDEQLEENETAENPNEGPGEFDEQNLFDDEEMLRSNPNNENWWKKYYQTLKKKTIQALNADNALKKKGKEVQQLIVVNGELESKLQETCQVIEQLTAYMSELQLKLEDKQRTEVSQETPSSAAEESAAASEEIQMAWSLMSDVMEQLYGILLEGSSEPSAESEEQNSDQQQPTRDRWEALHRRALTTITQLTLSDETLKQQVMNWLKCLNEFWSILQTEKVKLRTTEEEWESQYEELRWDYEHLAKQLKDSNTRDIEGERRNVSDKLTQTDDNVIENGADTVSKSRASLLEIIDDCDAEAEMNEQRGFTIDNSNESESKEIRKPTPFVQHADVSNDGSNERAEDEYPTDADQQPNIIEEQEANENDEQDDEEDDEDDREEPPRPLSARELRRELNTAHRELGELRTLQIEHDAEIERLREEHAFALKQSQAMVDQVSKFYEQELKRSQIREAEIRQVVADLEEQLKNQTASSEKEFCHAETMTDIMGAERANEGNEMPVGFAEELFMRLEDSAKSHDSEESVKIVQLLNQHEPSEFLEPRRCLSFIQEVVNMTLESRNHNNYIDTKKQQTPPEEQRQKKEAAENFDSALTQNEDATRQDLMAQITNLERDNFYYRQTSRDLKQKLREFVAVHEKHLEALKKSKEARIKLKQENSQLRKQLLEGGHSISDQV